MSNHNIGFYEDLTKIIFELSSDTHLIKLNSNNGADLYLPCCQTPMQVFSCHDLLCTFLNSIVFL